MKNSTKLFILIAFILVSVISYNFGKSWEKADIEQRYLETFDYDYGYEEDGGAYEYVINNKR